MTEEILTDAFLGQGLKEILYSFAKNGGDLDYCVKQIKGDFAKASWKSPEEVEGIFKKIDVIIALTTSYDGWMDKQYISTKNYPRLVDELLSLKQEVKENGNKLPRA